ncbi:HoxN/HupN/NixA family nickel/cobalt transporter [Patescibacteria group bacterium]|nr:HoxN/HupN/NixA family nickel/cobalt transporter [Patescibacteria group bacterium]
MKLPGKLHTLFSKTSPGFRRRLTALATILILLNLSVWAGSLWASVGNTTFVGLVVLAYGLGLRHAVDADHIAAIDNTTRKLMGEGKRPVGVGFFFSLGHSTIVVALSVAIAFFASYIRTNLPAFRSTGALVGTLVSSVFLLLIGFVNLFALLDIVRVWRRVIRGGGYDAREIRMHLETKGFLARFFRPFLGAVSASWNMYFVGFLFGLGFDTASEVGLLSLSAATGAGGMEAWKVLLLPVAFTAGMSLIDTLDGILMLGAYGWAYVKPVRKLYYNLNITFISVVIALFIGGVEGVQLLARELGWGGLVIRAINRVDLGNMGYIIIIAFLLSWLLSLAVYRLKGYDNLGTKTRS